MRACLLVPLFLIGSGFGQTAESPPAATPPSAVAGSTQDRAAALSTSR
jgi:hypothetical protein